jgi:hypothetical protein
MVSRVGAAAEDVNGTWPERERFDDEQKAKYLENRFCKFDYFHGRIFIEHK